ncbi:hypothetical protein ARMSODRAFT_1086526 [Armillaria solidipes]|uniref:F-box domain-containing protein n=1 Tax=Armillaria solidipes TaxID=1076256 RepID=A0A2H3BUH6_9AGAR|nr:hypothetical protein ARMSODRAFT_1086526 [Armillaria solidipes]
MARDAGTRLPQELFDAIIDAVRVASPVSEAFKDLVSCSLVSRRFLPRTRYFLFEAIFFDSPEEISSYYTMCLKNPTISSSARCLVLDTQKLVSDTFDDSLLISILQLTTNIVTLSLENVSWEEISPGLLSALARYRLKNLFIKNVTIPSISSFHSFIRRSATCSLSRLGLYESLTVGRSDDDDSETEALVPVPEKSVVVQSLSVACFQKSQDMTRSILFSPSSPFNFLGLTETEVVFSQCSDQALSQDSIYLLRDVVSASDSRLLAHIDMGRAFQRAPPPYLLYLPSLCTLGFLLNNANSLGFQPIPVLQWWIDVFVHSKCYSLSRLTISAIATGQSWVIAKDALTQWRRLDKELSSSRYDMYAVRIIYKEHRMEHGDSDGLVADVLTRNMPGLFKQGVLQVYDHLS